MNVRIGEGCIECRRCSQVCPTGAIQGRKVSPTECIRCFNCTSRKLCPAVGVTHRFGPWLRRNRDEYLARLPGRRLVLASAAGALVALPLLSSRVPGLWKRRRLLRPPGAPQEPEFLARCIRCGRCMKACPNNALQPTVLEAGVEGFWSPRLVPRVGYCLYDCAGLEHEHNNRCGMSCPTGAIRRLTFAERSQDVGRMGLARLEQERCIPYADGVNCSMCVPVCPVAALAENVRPEEGALSDDADAGLRLPYVLEERCIGCGACEFVCPVHGPAAIRVHPHAT